MPSDPPHKSQSGFRFEDIKYQESKQPERDGPAQDTSLPNKYDALSSEARHVPTSREFEANAVAVTDPSQDRSASAPIQVDSKITEWDMLSVPEQKERIRQGLNSHDGEKISRADQSVNQSDEKAQEQAERQAGRRLEFYEDRNPDHAKDQSHDR